jgi:hypothetical protein
VKKGLRQIEVNRYLTLPHTSPQIVNAKGGRKAHVQAKFLRFQAKSSVSAKSHDSRTAFHMKTGWPRELTLGWLGSTCLCVKNEPLELVSQYPFQLQLPEDTKKYHQWAEGLKLSLGYGCFPSFLQF